MADKGAIMHVTGRAAATSSFARRVASLAGAASVELGLRDDPAAVARDVLALIAEPVELFERHPVWPAQLTGTGQPVELSLKLEPNASALRWVVDVTDHRVGFAGNWSRYLRYAAIAAKGTGVDADELSQICRHHLTGIPPGVPTRMMHGSGVAPTGWSRGSLYFNTAWLGDDEFDRRFPRQREILAEVERLHGSPVTGVVDVLGYDFVEGAPTRVKAYVRPRVARAQEFEAMAGSHPDLAPARLVFEALGGASIAGGHPHPHLLQVSVDEGTVRQRLFFFASAWRWQTGEARERVFGVLSRDLGVDLEPLSVLDGLAVDHGVPLHVAMIAIGGLGDGVSVTFYFWPQAANGHGGLQPAFTVHGAPPARLERARDRALDYLAACRDDNGRWREDDDEISSAFVTAYVGSALSAEGRGPPPGSSPDPAAVLLALLESECRRFPALVGAVFSVIDAQEPDGRWRSSLWADDVVATWHALRALHAYGEHELSRSPLGRASGQAARAAIQRAIAFLGSAPVAAEPLSLAAWMASWRLAGRGPDDLRIQRAAAALLESQQPDGSWAGGQPLRATDTGKLLVDSRRLVTTATVAVALDGIA